MICLEASEMDLTQMGSLLQRLRKEQGMTQRALAQRLCVSEQAVSKWERGLSLN